MLHDARWYIIDIHLPDGITQLSGSHLDEWLIPVCKLILIDVTILPHPEPWSGLHVCDFDDVIIHRIDIHLRTLHDVKVSESPRSILDGECSADNKGKLTVLIESFFVSLFPLRAEGQPISHNDGQMQDSLHGVDGHGIALIISRSGIRSHTHMSLIVHVDDLSTVGCVDVVIVQILGDLAGILRSDVLCDLWESRLYRIHILKAHMIHLRRLLDVIHSWLPEEIVDIDISNTDISKAITFAVVPEDSGDCSTIYGKVPPHVSVHILIVVILQCHRNDVGQRLGLFLIIRLSRKDVRLWETVHDVRMLVQDTVDCPC